MQLSREILRLIKDHPELDVPEERVFELPEKVLQFGTGILLRGLPDYFIDKANKKDYFNGRIVIVKSTSNGGTDEFAKQDCLYTHCVKGIEEGREVEEMIVNASISRVLSASDDWNNVLRCAHNPDLELIISNTTEVGIVPSDDDISLDPPPSFPGKLLAFLYERYLAFNGAEKRGMVIIPTELISENGDKLREYVIDLARKNELSDGFMHWLQSANHFCNSLVDRIVPGKLPDVEKKVVEQKLGYTDELMIMSESFRLWAIESSSDKVRQVLSFAKADEGVVITGSIEKFRELKLRLLNGTHTFSCALALLAGFETVKQAMNHEQMLGFVRRLMLEEIAVAMQSSTISYDEASAFAAKVIDRFRNPYLDHKWLSISMNYTSKMKLRNIPLLSQYIEKEGKIPSLMALGFAAYIVFMNCSAGEDQRYYANVNGRAYLVDDDAARYFAQKWSVQDSDKVVDEILSDKILWGADLSSMDGFARAVKENVKLIQSEGAMSVVNSRQLQQIIAE